MTNHTTSGQESDAVDLLKDVPLPLTFFIMGDHRSGTTLLYSMLDRTGCFNTVTPYHILYYDELLMHHRAGIQQQKRAELAARFQALGLTDRKIDGVMVTPDLPEEYGFLLSTTHNAPLRADNLPRFNELCRKVQVVGDRSRPLLLKNPWDYFRNFMYVKTQVPEAKFIFIQRHPVQVINSQVRAIRTSLASKNGYLALLSRWYAQLFQRPLRRQITRLFFGSQLGVRVTTRHVLRGQQYLLDHIDQLPASDSITVKYEDVCADPASQIARICAFLGLDTKHEVNYSAMITPRPSNLVAGVTRSYPVINRQAGPYLARYGYEL